MDVGLVRVASHNIDIKLSCAFKQPSTLNRTILEALKCG